MSARLGRLINRVPVAIGEQSEWEALAIARDEGKRLRPLLLPSSTDSLPQ